MSFVASSELSFVYPVGVLLFLFLTELICYEGLIVFYDYSKACHVLIEVDATIHAANFEILIFYWS